MATLKWTSRPRFSLRSMFAVLTVGCIILGWHVEKRHRLMIVAEHLQSALHCVSSFHTEPHDLPYDPRQLLTRFWDAEMLPSRVATSDIRDERTLVAICQLTTIERMSLASSDLCDDWLRHLESLQSLRDLSLCCPHLTDRAIPHLCKLKSLENFDTICCGFTYEGIQQLRRALPNLSIAIHGNDKASSADYPPLNGSVVNPRASYPEMYSAPTP